MEQELLTIGKIVNTQGHLGEVRCITYSDNPERLINKKTIHVKYRGSIEVFHIEAGRLHKNFVVYKFAKVADMTQAEALKDAELLIPKSELEPLPKGHYYHFELIGLRVETVQGQELGEIGDILRTGSNDVYVVKRPELKDLLIPAIKDVVKDIDLAKGKIFVELMEGLL